MAVDWQAFATAFLSDSAKYISENKDRAADYRDKITEQADKNKGIFTKRKMAASSILQQIKLAEGLNATPGMIRSALSSGPDGIVQLTQNLAKMKRDLEADGGNWTAESALLRVELPEFFVSGAGAKAPSEGYKSLVDQRYGVNVGEIGSTKPPEVSGFKKALGYNAKEFVRSSLDEDSAFGTGMSTYDLSQIDATAPYTFDENQQGFITYKASNFFGSSAISAEQQKIANASNLISRDPRFIAAQAKIKQINDNEHPEQMGERGLQPAEKLQKDRALLKEQADIQNEVRLTILNSAISQGVAKFGKETYFSNELLAETLNSVAGDAGYASRQLAGSISTDENVTPTGEISVEDFKTVANSLLEGNENLDISYAYEDKGFSISNNNEETQKRFKFKTDNTGKITSVEVIDLTNGAFVKSYTGDDLNFFLERSKEVMNAARPLVEEDITEVPAGPGTISDFIISGSVPEAVAWGVTEFEKFFEVAKEDRKYFNEDGTITASGIDRAKQFYTQDSVSPLPSFRGAFFQNPNEEGYKLFGATVGEAYNAKVTGTEAPAVESEAEKQERLRAEAAKIEQAKLDAEAKTESERLEKLKLAEESAARVKAQEIKEKADAEEASRIAAQVLVDQAAAKKAEIEQAEIEQAKLDAAIIDPDVVALSNWEQDANLGRIKSTSSNLTTRNTSIKSAITRYLTDKNGSKPSTEEVIALSQKYIEVLKTGKFD